MKLPTVFHRNYHKIVGKRLFKGQLSFLWQELNIFIEKKKKKVKEMKLFLLEKKKKIQSAAWMSLKIFVFLASVSPHLSPISPHAICTTYDPHHSLIIFFLPVCLLLWLYQMLISLFFFLYSVSSHKINSPTCERFTLSPFFFLVVSE